jgi:hypothetical protein
MHLQCDFDFVTRLECGEVVCQLLGVRVLLEERGSRNLVLTSSIAAGLMRAIGGIGTRDILATNLVSIHYAFDDITGTKLNGSIAMSEAIVKCRNRKEQTIRLLTAEANSTNISLVGLEVASDVVAGVVLLADEVVLFRELYGQLSISREVNTELALGIISRYTDSITEHISQQ